MSDGAIVVGKSDGGAAHANYWVSDSVMEGRRTENGIGTSQRQGGDYRFQFHLSTCVGSIGYKAGAFVIKVFSVARPHESEAYVWL